MRNVRLPWTKADMAVNDRESACHGLFTSANNGHCPRGLTIVEVLIVVIVLGIVAFTVVPRFSRAASDHEDSRLKSHLEVVRRQIELYRIEHDGQFPSATNEDAFLDQMLRRH
ncbi:MAG: prepilin-type N-terminal cleavage/methylation domain-containing protein, partial [Phycisphaerales bacterium]|nr:prepilin-type N-terminal cleavage/methylation domain-containing protein [Phycisphaerales bacterium]